MKERYQNPVIGDTVRLRLFIYNGNNTSDVSSIDKIDLFVADPTEVTPENPHGKTFVTTLDVSQVVREDTGTYYIDVPINTPLYTTGRYFDLWSMTVANDQPTQTVENEFRIYPQLWYTTPIPVVYDFSFTFAPNKMRQGSKQYIRAHILPNVPRASDIERYYNNLAIVSDLKISLEFRCGPCVTNQCDSQLILDQVDVDYREKCFGYYLLDTSDMDEGIYAIWFTLNFGGNIYISDKMNFQIFS